jgi:hypothetical protein
MTLNPIRQALTKQPFRPLRIDPANGRSFTIEHSVFAKEPIMSDKSLRNHLVELLKGGHAHLDFDSAIEGLPAALRGTKPANLPHTPWRLLEHMRIAQWDIHRFSIDPHHVSPEFPGGYWPEGDGPPDSSAWDRSVEGFRADLRSIIDLVNNSKTDLFAPIAHGQGQTILREALLVADHNAYHLGQFVTVRRLLGVWSRD